uniref:Glucosylceramidase n=1 Tax=Meloidogyne javanica TaxID=6303 RepID=A0A915LHL9_MELJA
MANRYRIGQPFRLLAAPWASPGWMKTNGKMNGDGELKGDLNGPYYHSYAKYLKKFFDEYHANGINFWALTIQNQPESGLEKDFPFQTMFMSNRTQREFAKQLLLPLFQKSEYTVNLKLIAFDDVREHLVVSASEIFDKQTHSSLSKKSFEQTDTFLDQLLPLVPDFVIDGVKNVGIL